MRKDLILFIYRNFVKIIVNLIILVNIRKIIDTNKIFVNFNSFGHSIIETSTFFRLYGSKSICISVGSSQDRNKYFRELYKPNILIHYWLPKIKANRIHLRVHTGLMIINSIEKSLLIQIFNPGVRFCCESGDLVDQGAKQLLVGKYQISEEKAQNLIEKFKQDFKESSNVNGSSISLLMSNKNRQKINLSTKMHGQSIKYNKMLSRFNSLFGNNKPNVCTLIVRKSKKDWSGVGLENYIDVIKYLHQKKYIINVIGDIENFEVVKRASNLANIYNYADYGINSKLFEILSVLNSDFCLGDPSGANVIPHFFSKKCLIMNNISIAQLQYNSISLPKIWYDQNGLRASKKMHFTDLLSRQSPLKLSNKTLYKPHPYPSAILLQALDLFLETIQTEIKTLNFAVDKLADYNSIIYHSERANLATTFLDELH